MALSHPRVGAVFWSQLFPSHPQFRATIHSIPVFASVPKSPVFRSFSNEEPCVGHVTVSGGSVTSGAETAVSRQRRGGGGWGSRKVNLPQPLRKCAGGVWALVPTGGGGGRPGGSQAVMLMMTAALTSSPRVFPYLSFSQPAASRSLAQPGHVT